MTYRSEPELLERAASFISLLKTIGIDAATVPGSARDYLLKLAIRRNGRPCGLVSLYHKPSKNTFTITFNELTDRTLIEELQRCFDGNLPEQSSIADGCNVYVDGSFTDGRIGYGAVVLQEGKPIKEFSGPVADAAVQSMRQVAGELVATTTALNWCLENGISQLTVYYDYAGIEAWATGAWKANLPLTRQYRAFMDDYCAAVQVAWHKIESHTGNRWNDRADALAKQGTQHKQLNLPTPSQSKPTASVMKAPGSVPGVLTLVTDRYQRLKPYRDYAVDFGALVEALQLAIAELKGERRDLSALDFDSLEALYRELMGGSLS